MVRLLCGPCVLGPVVRGYRGFRESSWFMGGSRYGLNPRPWDHSMKGDWGRRARTCVLGPLGPASLRNSYFFVALRSQVHKQDLEIAPAQ